MGLPFTLPSPVVAVLSTYNRPDLLAQAMISIQRECIDAGVPLVIADDHSTEPRTLALLDLAERQGATLTRRVKQKGERADLHPAVTIGLNWIHIVRWMEKNAPPDAMILKLDDDIVLMPGAFKQLFLAWTKIIKTHDTPGNMLALSGITTINESVSKDFLKGSAPYIEVSGPASPCVLHRLDLWKQILDADEVGPVKQGFDSYFVGVFAPTQKNGKMYATRPSVAYHAGHCGVHLLGQDVNRYPPDPLACPIDVGKVFQHHGDKQGKRWLRQYGHRRHLPP